MAKKARQLTKKQSKKQGKTTRVAGVKTGSGPRRPDPMAKRHKVSPYQEIADEAMGSTSARKRAVGRKLGEFIADGRVFDAYDTAAKLVGGEKKLEASTKAARARKKK